MQKLVVPEKFNGKKTSEFLLEHFSGLTKNTLYKALRKKDIRINNTKINTDTIVNSGDVVSVYIVDELLFSKTIIAKIYEDANILIINKPTGIEVTGSNSISSILKKEYIFVAPCHRLDRNTTGITIFAKNEEALRILLNKFKSREIEKHYLAKVYGIPTKKEETLSAYLFKDNKKSMVYISETAKKGYVKIMTSYTVISKNLKENFSILDVELHTGKTHQIRAHLAHIGYPIIGDGKYGINEVNKKFGCKTQQLCSYKLTFRFTKDAGILNYLNNKQFEIDSMIVY